MARGSLDYGKTFRSMSFLKEVPLPNNRMTLTRDNDLSNNNKLGDLGNPNLGMVDRSLLVRFYVPKGLTLTECLPIAILLPGDLPKVMLILESPMLRGRQTPTTTTPPSLFTMEL
jgi:hypothetical protein